MRRPLIVSNVTCRPKRRSRADITPAALIRREARPGFNGLLAPAVTLTWVLCGLNNGRKVYVWEAAMADHRRSNMMWRAAGYFITAVTIAGWVVVLAYWLNTHGWVHIRGLA